MSIVFRQTSYTKSFDEILRTSVNHRLTHSTPVELVDEAKRKRLNVLICSIEKTKRTCDGLCLSDRSRLLIKRRSSTIVDASVGSLCESCIKCTCPVAVVSAVCVSSTPTSRSPFGKPIECITSSADVIGTSAASSNSSSSSSSKSDAPSGGGDVKPKDKPD